MIWHPCGRTSTRQSRGVINVSPSINIITPFFLIHITDINNHYSNTSFQAERISAFGEIDDLMDGQGCERHELVTSWLKDGNTPEWVRKPLYSGIFRVCIDQALDHFIEEARGRQNKHTQSKHNTQKHTQGHRAVECGGRCFGRGCGRTDDSPGFFGIDSPGVQKISTHS